MKLFVDDIRSPMDDGWLVARTISRAKLLIITAINNSEELEWISFDHDLGGNETSRSLLNWMVTNRIQFHKNSIHSANPVGKKWLEEGLRRDYEKPSLIVRPPRYIE